MSKLLQKSETLEIQSYKQPKDTKTLLKEHVPFTGSPKKHPYDKNKIILIADPTTNNAFYYEFKTDDIAYAEELPTTVNINDETVLMIRIWIKKKSIGVQCTPFLVENLRDGRW